MKYIATLIYVLMSSSAFSEELIPVQDSPFNLCESADCIYFEWKFKSDPNLWYVAAGCHDGMDYCIGRVNSAGKLEILLKINPIVKDQNEKYWWGYPDSTKDIPVVIKNSEVFLYAYFNHNIVIDHNITIPEWQK